MTNLKSLINDIPLTIRLFLGKALLFFILWKVVYTFFLFDSQLIDKPLTEHVAVFSAKVLNSLGSMNGFSAVIENYTESYGGEILNNQVSSIYHYDNKVLHIANVCNGLELIVLYIGFIVCMPSSLSRKIKYIIIGVILLDLVNISRCVGLIYLREYFHQYFQFAHHYLFKITVYLSTFIMWMVFTRKTNLKSESV